MQIDWWTLALQTINFLILVWLLSKFLYRPVAAIVAQRQAAASKLITDAEAERLHAQSERAEIAQIRKGFDGERAKILEEARSQADAESRTLMAEAKAQAAKLFDDAKAAAAREAALSQRAFSRQAEELALAIAGQLLARVRLESPAAPFLDPLCDKIRHLPPQSKGALQYGSPIEIMTAAALTKEQEERVRQVLAGCIGAQPKFAFRTDPTLIAGIELASRDIALRNSWREDLRAIRAELEREEADHDVS